MNDKIRPIHLERAAYVYVRQSSLNQVRHHHESRRRQYDLKARAQELGFTQIVIIDDDQGISGAGDHQRPGFGRLLAAVCEGRAGTVLALEASRLARNNRDWHHLIDLCMLTDTLVIDKCEAIKNVKQPMEKPVESDHDSFSASHFSADNQLCLQRLQPPNQAGVLAPRGGASTRFDDGLGFG